MKEVLYCRKCKAELTEFGKNLLIHKYHPYHCTLKLINKERYMDELLASEKPQIKVE